MAKTIFVHQKQQLIDADQAVRRLAYIMRDQADFILDATLAETPILEAPNMAELKNLSEAMSAYNQALRDEVKVVKG